MFPYHRCPEPLRSSHARSTYSDPKSMRSPQGHCSWRSSPRRQCFPREASTPGETSGSEAGQWGPSAQAAGLFLSEGKAVSRAPPAPRTPGQPGVVVSGFPLPLPGPHGLQGQVLHGPASVEEWGRPPGRELGPGFQLSSSRLWSPRLCHLWSLHTQ